MWHTNRVGESPAHALKELDGRVINVHLKDARRTADGWQLILLGEGDIPVKDGLRLLHDAGYHDFIAVEWEKKWHPEIPDPEVAFPQHMAVLRKLRPRTGVTRYRTLGLSEHRIVDRKPIERLT
jgi:fatty-acyl-CoA synthase